MRRFAAPTVLLALCACKPAPDTEQTVAPSNPPPVLAPAAPRPFSGDINALGTEPFWAVEVRETTLKLSRPDHTDVIAPNAGPKVLDGKATWASPALTLTLRPEPCSDGMSDRRYGWTAEVLSGGETLKGCAATAADLADQPRP